MTSGDSDAVFSALADPTRRAILEYIASHDEPTVGEIAEAFPSVGRTAVSSHLRILRLAQLVSERRDGRFRRYTLRANPADAVVSFLAAVYRHSLHDLAAAIKAAEADWWAAGTGTEAHDAQSDDRFSA